jgi:hypothetical protein
MKKAMGGVLFIDEACYLYRPENERDYGQEAIEILLQVMENQRDDLVVASLHEYVPLRIKQPHFANARSIRNTLDRARLHRANRLFAQKGRRLDRDVLMTIEGEDLRASRVLT